jgi:hypothetical protein
MEHFIQQISVSVVAVSRIVGRSDYDLLENEIIVPPHMWESMVFPGSLAIMRARNVV